jgi:hypothetical protein
MSKSQIQTSNFKVNPNDKNANFQYLGFGNGILVFLDVGSWMFEVLHFLYHQGGLHHWG